MLGRSAECAGSADDACCAASPCGYAAACYQRELLGQDRVGHISPLAAYDRDKVLILDTAAHKYPPTWAPVERLFAAMQTVDGSSGKMRGYVEVR